MILLDSWKNIKVKYIAYIVCGWLHDAVYISVSCTAKYTLRNGPKKKKSGRNAKIFIRFIQPLLLCGVSSFVVTFGDPLYSNHLSRT